MWWKLIKEVKKGLDDLLQRKPVWSCWQVSFLCCLWCYPILFTFLLLIFVIHGKICSFNKSQYDQFSSKLRKIAFNFIPSLSIYSCSHSMYFLTFKYFLLQFYVFFLNSVAEILLFSQTYYTHHTSLVNYLFPFNWIILSWFFNMFSITSDSLIIII